MKRGRRGISPVIATVLLIGLVVVIGTIIFLWIKGFVKEEGTKFGKNVALVCPDVNFETSYNSGELTVHNIGDVPIFRVNVKMYTSGGYKTENITEIASGWPLTGVKQGEVFSEDISSSVPAEITKMVVIPVLIASSGGGQKVYTCGEQYGVEAPI